MAERSEANNAKLRVKIQLFFYIWRLASPRVTSFASLSNLKLNLSEQENG